METPYEVGVIGSAGVDGIDGIDGVNAQFDWFVGALDEEQVDDWSDSHTHCSLLHYCGYHSIV